MLSCRSRCRVREGACFSALFQSILRRELALGAVDLQSFFKSHGSATFARSRVPLPAVIEAFQLCGVPHRMSSDSLWISPRDAVWHPCACAGFSTLQDVCSVCGGIRACPPRLGTSCCACSSSAGLVLSCAVCSDGFHRGAPCLPSCWLPALLHSPSSSSLWLFPVCAIAASRASHRLFGSSSPGLSPPLRGVPVDCVSVPYPPPSPSSLVHHPILIMFFPILDSLKVFAGRMGLYYLLVCCENHAIKL